MAFGSKIDLNRLEIFKTVVLAGSFSKAATQLKQPKSRVSRNISALEKEIGLPLIYRTTRQFQITDAGHILFQKILPLLNELRSTLEMVSQSGDEIEGPIKLTVPEDIGTELMGPIVTQFLLRYPKVDLHLISSNEYVDLVAESIDVAVRIGQIRDSSMIQKHIGVVQMGFFASPDYLKDRTLDGSLASLERLDHLSFKPNQRTLTLKLQKGKLQKTLKVTPAFTSNNFFILRTMATQNMGVAQMPIFIGQKLVQEGRLIQIFKQWTQEPSPIRILIPQQKDVPVRIKKLMEFLTDNIAARL